MSCPSERSLAKYSNYSLQFTTIACTPIIHHIHTYNIYIFYFIHFIHIFISSSFHGRLAVLGFLCPIHVESISLAKYFTLPSQPSLSLHILPYGEQGPLDYSTCRALLDRYNDYRDRLSTHRFQSASTLPSLII
jgi:hypothetical protein